MLKVITAPDPILNTVCVPYSDAEFGTSTLKKFAKQLAKTMYKFDGVGLAAPQVGFTKRIIVVDCTDQKPPAPFVLVNPEILEAWGSDTHDKEGCLSVPGIQIEIPRAEWVRVSYRDVDGEAHEFETDGLLARCLQHEIDHLNGKTMLESCPPAVRLQALQAYEEAKRNGAKPGEVE